MSVDGAELAGSFVQPYKGLTYFPDPTDKTSPEIVDIPGAGKITGVLGSKEDEDGGSKIYGGSIGIAAAKGSIVKETLE